VTEEVGDAVESGEARQAFGVFFVTRMKRLCSHEDESIDGILSSAADLSNPWVRMSIMRTLLILPRDAFLSRPMPFTASCATDHGKELCQEAGGACVIWLDGYVVQVNFSRLISSAYNTLSLKSSTRHRQFIQLYKMLRAVRQACAPCFPE